MTRTARDRKEVERMGIHWVLYKLNKLGWVDAELPPNTSGADVVLVNRNNDAVTAEIKAMSEEVTKQSGGDFFFKDPSNIAQFVIVVTNADTAPQSFVLTRQEVQAHRRDIEWVGKDGKKSYYLVRRIYDNDNCREQWTKIRYEGG